MMTNSQILSRSYNLLVTCCSYQAGKYNVPVDLRDDLVQEMSLILLEYDNAKLNDIYERKHLNAFITGILYRQCYSRNSQFYRKFRKFQDSTDELSYRDGEYDE